MCIYNNNKKKNKKNNNNNNNNNKYIYRYVYGLWAVHRSPSFGRILHIPMRKPYTLNWVAVIKELKLSYHNGHL